MNSQLFRPDDAGVFCAKGRITPMQWLTVRRLKLADIPSAFPLIQLHHRGLTLAQWTDYARGILIDSNGVNARGFLAAYDGEAINHGVLQYERRRDVAGRPRLIATNIMACGLFHRHRIRIIKALSQSLSQMAPDFGCERVAFEVSANDRLAPLGSLPSLLKTFGHQTTYVTFSNRI
jgi:hypothetical protein